MSDLQSMGTFEQYVQGLALVPAAEIDRCKALQQELRQLGLPKTLEELTLRLGILSADRLAVILADIKQKWQITISRPVILPVTPDSDQALQEKIVQSSPKGAVQVLECRQIKEKAESLGLYLTITEILIAKGYHVPEGAPVTAEAPVTVAAVESTDEVSEDPPALELLPEAPPSKEQELALGPDRVAGNRKHPGQGPTRVGIGHPKPVPGTLKLGESPFKAHPAPHRPSGAPIKLGESPYKPPPSLPKGGTAKVSHDPPHAGLPAAKRPTGMREREVAEPAAPSKAPNSKLTFWIGIGAAGVLFVAALVILIMKSGASAPPPPEPTAPRTAMKAPRAQAAPEKPAESKEAALPRESESSPLVGRKFDPNAAPLVIKGADPAPAPEKHAEPAPAAAEPAKPDAAPTSEPAKPEPKAQPAAPEPAKPALPPPPPPVAKPNPPGKAPATSDPAKDAREAKAQALWDQAEQLERDSKFAEAQERLRELRSRYRSTRVFFDKMIEITDKINELGVKIAGAALLRTSYYKRPHMDSWWSFEFVPPEGWKGVPAQPNLVGEQDNDESFYKGRTYQMARYNSPYLDKLYIEILKTFACTGLDNLESKVSGELESRFKGLKEETKTMLAGKMPYLRKTYVSNDGDRLAAYYYYGDHKGLALVGIWRAGGDGFYVSMTRITSTSVITRKTSDHPVSDTDFLTALKVFDQCAKTFWIYDAAARAGKRVDLQMGALCSDWSTIRSSKGNYIIDFATRPDFAKRAGEEMEQLQALYRHVIPTQKPIPPCRIKIFDREEEFKDYCGFLGAAAYWSPMQEEIVAYRFEGDKLRLDSKEEMTIAEEKNPEDVTFKILYHEGFHQYMHFYMGRARNIYVPSWLNEGMGDYFFGGDWNKGRNKFSIGVNDWRIVKIVNAIKKNEHVPLDKIVHYDQMQYYSSPGLCYAEGWAINYFFQMSDVARKNGYNTIPTRMMTELKASGNWERATEKVFGGLDLKKMESEWKDFIVALPIPKDAVGADDPNK